MVEETTTYWIGAVEGSDMVNYTLDGKVTTPLHSEFSVGLSMPKRPSKTVTWVCQIFH